jgi:two-component system response regulator FixJ
MTDEVRVHVIDDDDAVRDSLVFLLDTADLPARGYDSARSFLDGLGAVIAGCVVSDVRMPGMSGIELLHELKARGIEAPVIVITGHGDVPLAIEAMRSGAFDFLEKPFPDHRLLGGIRRALLHASAEDEGNARALARARRSRLSEAEQRVLDGLVEGKLHQAIADELGVSLRTVEAHRDAVMTKMQVESFPDLVRMAILAGPRRGPNSGDG